MHKILKKISAAVQLVLLAPVKLPGKALNIIKYVALGLGVLETVISDKSDKSDRVTSDDSDGAKGDEADLHIREYADKQQKS
ncbi:hypothetical protein [Sphingobacterium yanglingense]|uniref:Uncharacterized protein n=1 Tax=Sphingobacterium yanglingense TaxID=1437280 RepID=A0A4R6W4Q0_9SPHI|nr:hypothetical protein [Sphingobacterium yanglingense]TDQ73674.1 hypothetical protein CLV99_4110 [Sphingobacterium yanglingense]